MRQSLSYICRALEAGKNLTEMKDDIRNLVNSYNGLNKAERAALYNSIYNVSRACKTSPDWAKTLSLRKNYDKILSASRKVYASQRLRMHKGTVRAELSRPGGTVFFLCSKHNNCADDHVNYQGKIYVDRFWRQKVLGSEYTAVLRFIKDNDVMTIQEAMGEPIWLTTRPYCRHHFIPVPTEEVLGVTVLSEFIDEYNMKHRLKLYEADDYYEFRSSIYNKLDGISPCKYFKEKIREN